MSEDVSEQIERARTALRTFVTKHGNAALAASIVLSFLCVFLVFSLVYRFAISGSIVSDEVSDGELSSTLHPVENHELPHLALRVSDVATHEYPVVEIALDIDGAEEASASAFAASSFVVSAASEDDTEIDASISRVDAGADEHELRIAVELEKGAAGSKQSVTLSLHPDSGFRGSAVVGFIVPDSEDRDEREETHYYDFGASHIFVS